MKKKLPKKEHVHSSVPRLSSSHLSPHFAQHHLLVSSSFNLTSFLAFLSSFFSFSFCCFCPFYYPPTSSLSLHTSSHSYCFCYFYPPTAPSPPSILFLAYALFRLPPIALATTSTTAYLLCVASAGHILASKEREGE